MLLTGPTARAARLLIVQAVVSLDTCGRCRRFFAAHHELEPVPVFRRAGDGTGMLEQLTNTPEHDVTEQVLPLPDGRVLMWKGASAGTGSLNLLPRATLR